MVRAAPWLALLVATSCIRNEFVYADASDASAGGSAGSVDAASPFECPADGSVDAASDCAGWCTEPGASCVGDVCELPSFGSYAAFPTPFGGRLIWTDAGAVRALAPDGSHSALYAQGGNPEGLSIECDAIHFTRTLAGELVRMDHFGGTQTKLSAALTRPRTLIRDGSDFYGVTSSQAGGDGAIWVLRGGQENPELLASGLNDTDGIAHDEHYVYFSHSLGIGRCSKSSSVCEPTAITKKEEYCNWKKTPLLIAEGRIFFSTPCNISSRTLDGQNGIDYLAGQSGELTNSFDVAGGHLYWTKGQLGGVVGEKLLVPGSTEDTIATAAAGREPYAVRVDPVAGFIYWIEQEPDGVGYLRKKRHLGP